jgi:ABC-type dipeptide/oligopeptide/nickel transport system permease subunit
MDALPQAADVIPPRRRLARLGEDVGRLLRNRIALAGLVLALLSVGSALLAPWLSPYAPDAMDYTAMLAEPSLAHPLGTDDLGRDILSRMLHGARLSLAVSLGAVAIAVVIGVPLGLLAGYAGGLLDEALMRVVDSVMALPSLVLALTITAVLGSGLVNAMLAIAIVTTPTFTRLVRGQVLSVKQNDYVLAAQAVGVRPVTLVRRHVLPNAINPVIVQAALGIGFAIITESSLSFIGLGAQPPTATWGSMVQVGFQYLETAPWFALAPAAAIFVAVLGFNMLGEGLREVMDPTSRGRG